MDMVIRKATWDDRQDAVIAEGLATPSLHYLDKVYDEWMADTDGELIVAEVDGRVVAVGKFSVVPDGSAWLEALRVDPAQQGQGIGKAFYRRFFELADMKGITTLRMYTGVTNLVSKGLAELFGFKLAGTFTGHALAVPAHVPDVYGDGFMPVTDPHQAAALLAPYAQAWNHFNIMNRTFYKASDALWGDWAKRGWIYAQGDTAVALGARFIPEQALHLAMFGGDADQVLKFAQWKARTLGNDKLQCMCPHDNPAIKAVLQGAGFIPESGDCITMEYVQGS
jgi:GNAT superfamily N-acetyltransferase